MGKSGTRWAATSPPSKAARRDPLTLQHVETYRSMFNRAERLVSDSIGKTGIENLHASMARAYNQNLRTIEEALAVVEAMKNANREIKAALPEVGQ